MSDPQKFGLDRLARRFAPHMPRPSFARSLRPALGAGAALGLMAGAGVLFPLPGPGLLAPMGASAVLVFAAPDSPLARPWNVMVGNAISAALALAIALMLPQAAVTPALATGAAILAMFLCRALHPPGGAVALTIAMGVKIAGVHAAWLVPAVIGQSLALVLTAMLFHETRNLRADS